MNSVFFLHSVGTEFNQPKTQKGPAQKWHYNEPTHEAELTTCHSTEKEQVHCISRVVPEEFKCMREGMTISVCTFSAANRYSHNYC